MQDDQLLSVLERIASALEKIANHLNSPIQTKAHTYHNHTPGPHPPLDLSDESTFINDTSDLEKFLNSKGVSIKHIREEDEADEVLDKIALFMGDRYSLIKKVYELIKRNLNSGRSFKLDLKNASQDEIGSITQLCTNLHQIAFLEEYKYFKSPKYYMYGKVNRIPKALNFFSGGWLERYVKTAILEAITSISHPVAANYSYLKNPQIQLPNGDDFELDILFKIEEEIFWLEAKTGEYQKYVQKYSKMSKTLNLDEDHAYMILTDITENSASALKSLFGMNVVNIDSFSETFKQAIQPMKQQLTEETEEDKTAGEE